MNRLDGLPTCRIDSSRKIEFSWQNRRFTGVAGDTVATALYAGGVRIFSRSLKYHRPRGLYSLDGESSNTCVGIDGIPNVSAENTVLKEGMQVRAQNVMGTPRLDLMGFLDKLDWAMPAGFYYRTMHRPAAVWPIALKQVRKMAGLGKISPDFQMPGRFDEIYPTADVCVIGGGPAGLSAALAAAGTGLRVIVMESRPWLGGFFDFRVCEYRPGLPLYERAAELAAQVEKAANIQVFKNTAMVGAYSNNLITAFQKGEADDPFDERYIEVRAKSVVVATGCMERPLLFENNERPGVMQAACAHRLAHTYGLVAGQKAVFSIGHDLGIEAAIDLFDLGLEVSCVADIRKEGQDRELVEKLAERGIDFLPGWTAVDCSGKTVKSARLCNLDTYVQEQFECDLLVASAGMTPVTGPLCLAQAKMAYDAHTGYFLPRQLPARVHACGRLLGLNDAAAIEVSGQVAGYSATLDCGVSVEEGLRQAREKLDSLAGPAKGCDLVMAPVKGRKAFICFDEDTTVKNIKQTLAMGFDATELIKRFSAAGTGPAQGAIPGHNLALFVARYHGRSSAITQPTTVRDPLVPVHIATYAGAYHDMCKRTPMHDAQKTAGGIMQRIGVWKRARYFSSDTACTAEIENVRNNVGMLDATTLGKFRIWGPDAVKALQRVYISDMSKIREGRIKYSAMCNEDGCIIDDGVVVKRGENDYYFTTSTARAGQTVEWFRYHSRYDNWDFNMVNLTDAYGVINLAGPNARKVLEKLTEADITNSAFAYGGFCEFKIKNTIPVRAMRLGFVGELSFELHVPSSYMQSLWAMLEEAGRPFNIQPFGLEAQNVLRMEKGHLIIGSESEQRTTLNDVGLSFLWDRSKSKAGTVGAVALMHTEKQEGRLKLVGFKMDNAQRAPRDGSIVVDQNVCGHVCIARYSTTLKEVIGMALVKDHLAGEGAQLDIYEDECNGQLMHAHVVKMPFYDVKGERLSM